MNYCVECRQSVIIIQDKREVVTETEADIPLQLPRWHKQMGGEVFKPTAGMF